MCNILPGAEPPLYPIYNQGLFGYMDQKGEIVIAPRFTKAHLFGDDGLALALLPNPKESFGNHMQVFIDRLGNVVIGPGPPKQFGRYDEAMRHIAIGLELDWEYSDFSNGRARIYDSRTESSGYIDTAGNLVIPVVYKFANDFSEGIASVEHNSRPMLISKDGKKIASFAENISLGRQFREGFLEFSIQTGPSTWRCGYVGKNGQTVIKAQYSFASCYSEGIAAVCDSTSDKIGYLNTQGEIVIPFKYDDWTD